MKYIALLFMLITVMPDVRGQEMFWQQTNGPEGGLVRAIESVDSTMVAGGIGGIFRSSDGGESWTHVGLSYSEVTKIVRWQTTLFLGTDQHGFFQSTDAGASWTQLNGGLPYSGVVDLAVKDTFIFAAIKYYGIFRKTVLGETWQSMNTGIDNLDVRTLIVSNESIVASSAGSSGSGMFRSVDNGETWTRLDPYRYAWMADAVCRYDNMLFASRSSYLAPVYTSTDDGQTWNLPSGGTPPGGIISALYADNMGLYAAIEAKGLFRSGDLGASWRKVSNGLYNQSCRFIGGDSKVIYIGSYDGIYKTYTAGAYWQAKNHGLTNSLISCICSVDGSILAGTHGSGLFRSSNLGRTWTQISPTVIRPFVAGMVYTQGSLYVLSAGSELDGTLFMSSNGGSTWIERRNGIDTGDLLSIAGDAGILYVGSGFGMFRSIDGGVNWTLMRNGLANNGRIKVGRIAAHGSVVIASTGIAGIYRSVDAGETWSLISVSPDGIQTIGMVAVVDTVMFASSWPGILYKSMDLGVTWQSADTPNLDGNVVDITGNSGVYFAALSGGGVLSNQGGPTWCLVNNGLFNSDVRSIHVAERRVWAGTWGAGVFRSVDSSDIAPQPLIASPTGGAMNQSTVTVLSWYGSLSAESYHLQLSTDPVFANRLIDDSTLVDTFRVVGPLEFVKTYYWRVSATNLFGSSRFSEALAFTTSPPGSFSLDQNYPNPFNPTTSIKFQIPNTNVVSLKVYDILGREVATLVDEHRSAGSYDVTWDASTVPSGVYFYRLRAGDFIQTKKLLLVR